MKYNTLPHTDIKVSKICLGTMTYGKQNTQEEAFEQMDYALKHGVNFFDTAELYPVPATAETHAETERIIGNWFADRKNRDKVVLATKIAGPGAYTAHIRTTGFSPDSIREAVDGSLKRLRTDYIDLYQLHWPERTTNMFGIRDYKHNPDDLWIENFTSILEALESLIQSGKIRQIGLSNENPWAVMRYMALAQKGLPRMVTIQNPYSLLNRLFEIGNAEVSLREGVGLLAYSPLAFGVLSGKYRGGAVPKNSRLDLFPRMARYSSQQCKNATEKYAKIADDAGISLTQMALAFVTQQPIVTSNIIGATQMVQLKENIDSTQIELSDDLIAAINAVHAEIPNPAP
jgi:aryl-alcohol dehydrogenase-like predicted oxidoreductase